MKRVNQEAPRSVKTLCGILLVLPVVDGVARYYQVLEREHRWQNIPSFWVYVCWFVAFVGLSVALARGINWIRWCFAVVATLGIIREFYVSVLIVGPIFRSAPPPLPLIVGTAVWLAYIVAVVLCFVPSSNKFFGHLHVPNQLPDPTSPSVTPAAGAAGAPSVAADH
jgi:hypothetical protein